MKIMKRKCLVVLVCLICSNIYSQNEFGHIIKEDKNLSKEWKESLYDRGEQKIYRDEELNTIGMPCGGIAAGQLYVRGDGTLANWWIANNAYNTGYGIDHLLNFETAQGPWKVCYQTFEPFSYFKQGFEIEIESGSVAKVIHNVSCNVFGDVVNGDILTIFKVGDITFGTMAFTVNIGDDTRVFGSST